MVHGAQTHIRVDSDQGIFGEGECTDAAGGAVSLIQSLRPVLIGQNPLDVEPLWERVRTMGIFSGAQGGQFVCALSGLEIALWDLAGKALGLPVYRLLGGKFRDRVRVYCDAEIGNPLAPDSDRKIAWIKSQGFSMIKMDLDDFRDRAKWALYGWQASNGEIDRMVKWVSTVRENMPTDMALACDFGHLEKTGDWR